MNIFLWDKRSFTLHGQGCSLTQSHIAENVLGRYEDIIQNTYKNTVVVFEAHSFLHTTVIMGCSLIKKRCLLCAVSIPSYKLKNLLLGRSLCVAQLCGGI